MADALWLPDIIADEFRGDRHVPVTVRPGWRTNGYSGFQPAGVLDHHTGSRPYTRWDSLLRYMDNGGYPYAWACNVATASPYAPDVPDRKFPIVIVAARRANHAGPGEFAWVSRLGLGGSAAMVGIEHYSTYDHTDWHPGHLEVQMRLDACLLEHMRQSWTHRGDHKEWAPDRKVDRHHLNTRDWDLALRELLADRAGGHDLTPPEGTIMPTDAERILSQLVEIQADVGALGDHLRTFGPQVRSIVQDELRAPYGPSGDRMSINARLYRAQHAAVLAAAEAEKAADTPQRSIVREEVRAAQAALQRSIADVERSVQDVQATTALHVDP